MEQPGLELALIRMAVLGVVVLPAAPQCQHPVGFLTQKLDIKYGYSVAFEAVRTSSFLWKMFKMYPYHLTLPP